jgi:dipeptidyl aminopeptidase/acylaminoacyl peptidase
MGQVQTLAYGSWFSPISADLIVAGSVGLSCPMLDGADIYWLEVRPAEGGRSVVVRRAADAIIDDMTPAPFNVRSSVHEYGGGAFTVHQGVVYFVNFADQGIYRQRPGISPEPVLVKPDLRFADLLVDPGRHRLICVCEYHSGQGEPQNSLVSIGLSDTEDSERLTVLASGADFYASPALSSDGRRLVWLSWNHPQMPWDGTELWLSKVNADGSLAPARLVAGSIDESIFQPQWGPDDRLYFVSDRSGWWNLYREAAGSIEPLLAIEAEFGLPQWVFGMSTYGFTGDGTIICSYRSQGVWRLLRLDPNQGRQQPFDLPYTDIDGVRCLGSRVVFHGGSVGEADAIVMFDAGQNTPAEVLRRSSQLAVDEKYISGAESIEFSSSGGRTAYGFFYAPANADFQAPAGVKPPLLVKSHGGPTASTSAAFNLGIQYWTSRGFAVVDVNYGGSTGYGRRYHQQLDGQWGVVDVDDCVAAAQYLIDAGQVDGERCAIRGNSAGGYTTLAALTFRELFRAGASYYGISDLEILARDTHKFESRYLDRLIGPYPQSQEIYRERSPLHFIDQLMAPMIFFQGLDDKVVPPNQAELMVAALRSKGVAVAYVPFPGERHGFRQAANIKRALEAELYFYSRIFNFPLAEDIEPVRIDNLTT